MTTFENPTKFEEFRKIARLNRDCVITEKIDGTNAQVLIYESLSTDPEAIHSWVDGIRGWTHLRIGSRNRWLSLESDNFGFAKWASDALRGEQLRQLGPGRHYGEWWGNGIQRGYGLPNGDKRFSLFNTGKWNADNVPACVSVVPVLYQGSFNTMSIKDTLAQLRSHGSYAAPFMDPEGIVIYHTHANQYFKVTLEDDELPKSVKAKNAA